MLLEKNRHRRANLEKILGMEWFNDFKDVSKARREASPETRFQAYTLTNTDGQEIQAEIKKV